jgi:hypothetical protein
VDPVHGCRNPKLIELITKDRKFDELQENDGTKYKLIYISGCSYKKMIKNEID